MNRITLQPFLAEGESFHLARNEPRQNRNDISDLHCHDFSEIFWIEEGEATHMVNNAELSLKTGDIIFIRPDDVHFIRSHFKKKCHFVNVAFSYQKLIDFKERFFNNDPNFWSGNEIYPQKISLNSIQLLELKETVDKMLLHSKSELMLEWFLTDLFRILTPGTLVNKNLPSWLSNALNEIKKPENFRKGSSVLSELSFKSKEHTSRVTTKLLGKTPSKLINEIRLKYASQALITKDIDIINLAYECGFKSLAQFYALFKKMFHMTPRQYQCYHRGIN
jgi:AraC family transcriptional regulator, dual regulator of chb operon